MSSEAVDILEDVLKRCSSDMRLAQRVEFGMNSEKGITAGLLYFTEQVGISAQMVSLHLSNPLIGDPSGAYLNNFDDKPVQKDFLEVDGELLRVIIMDRRDGLMSAHGVERFESRSAAEAHYAKSFESTAWENLGNECDFDGYEEIMGIVQGEPLIENLSGASLQNKTAKVGRSPGMRRI